MRGVWIIGGMAAVLAGAAQAQELEIENAAARVVVIPEARRDVQVTVTQGASALPALQVRRLSDGGVEIDGGLRRRLGDCGGRSMTDILRPDPQRTVEVRGIGRVKVADLPLITARVPLDAKVSAGGAIYGSIGRSRSLELSSAGCGDWTTANTGVLDLALAGSGGVAAGASERADVSLAGSGDVRLGPVAGSLDASIAGSGDIHAASVGGGLDASIAGSGDIIVEGGRTGSVDASILGSGDVRVAGVVQSLDASIAGSGDVQVAEVTGAVERSIMGSGDVVVGGRALGRRRDD